jgi:hypothetical protein
MPIDRMVRKFASGPDVQKAARHRDPSTTKLYDRREYKAEKAAFFCDVLMALERER